MAYTKIHNTKKDEEFLEPPPYQYFEQVITQKVHHFYLSQLVDSAEKYAEMIFRIQTANTGEIIYIHLNSPGGYLSTGIQMINSMQSSQAHIICSLEGEVASLGTMIFLAADEFVVHDNCMMMFHNYSGGVFGKGHEQIAALEATTLWTTEIMRRLYIPFMSQDEFNRIQKGEDIYFLSEEIRQRLVDMVKILEEEKAAEDKAEEAKNTPKPRRAKKKVARKKTS